MFDKEKSPGPGYMHLPNDLPYEILRMLASEAQFVKRARSGREIVTWQKKPGFRDNHPWDASVYCDLAAELAGVFALQDIDYVEMIKRAQKENKQEQGRAVGQRTIRTKY
jgi:phage terminase large subunit GpA-like protein